ncbi:MAG: hypothetical protein H0T42_27320 [Deltaproteobacteria bacterium]|nr:hypothetical protein [Deltaproteobacteria bacterium]
MAAELEAQKILDEVVGLTACPSCKARHPGAKRRALWRRLGWALMSLFAVRPIVIWSGRIVRVRAAPAFEGSSSRLSDSVVRLARGARLGDRSIGGHSAPPTTREAVIAQDHPLDPGRRSERDLIPLFRIRTPKCDQWLGRLRDPTTIVTTTINVGVIRAYRGGSGRTKLGPLASQGKLVISILDIDRQNTRLLGGSPEVGDVRLLFQ